MVTTTVTRKEGTGHKHKKTNKNNQIRKTIDVSGSNVSTLFIFTNFCFYLHREMPKCQCILCYPPDDNISANT